ncbi:MAG: DUF4214 domain-containing protein [Actinobacteria bacterium]|nr:DUF4214 domain-containing protein [Actinomycetota bacterium]
MAKKFTKKKLFLLTLPIAAILIVGLLLLNLDFTNIQVRGSSNDGVTAFVTRMYQQTLNRQPDPQGLASWVNGLKSGELSGANVARNFIFSQEFTNKNLSNEQFLNVMYKAFFNRAPDPGGYNGWLAKLESGKSREYVLARFVNSQEFNNLCQEYEINLGSLKVSTASTSTYAYPEANIAQNASADSANLSVYEQQVLALLNNIRMANGLSPLASNQSLTDISRTRSADMLDRDYFSHYTPEGANIFNILRANGISYKNAGENLAQSMPASAGSPEAFVNAWMNSSAHAANILKPQYARIGIGLAENNGRRVVTTVFMN